jgi:hypothetical protein
VTALGTIGSTVTTVQGMIAPDDSSTAVALYQFTVAEGREWQFGVTVSTQDSDSSLQSVLTLMSDDGTVIKSASSGSALFNDPNDPFLFAGLDPGTYMISVSAVPSPQGSAVTPTSGAFDLNLQALPHNQPSQLIGMSVNTADQDSPSPTSINLTFSGPIDVLSGLSMVETRLTPHGQPSISGPEYVDGLLTPDVEEVAIELVNSSGQVFPVNVICYDY